MDKEIEQEKEQEIEKDIWSEWLAHRRFDGDAANQARAMDMYKSLALKITDKAQIIETAVVLDIGAGDGLVGLTALKQLGPSGKLILSDISEAALAIPKEIFRQHETRDLRVEFLLAGAENLSALPGNSVDRVLMRSVLLYVSDKQAVFNEIYRVLKPEGIAVIMEPVNQRMVEFQKDLFRGYSLDKEPLLSVKSLLQKVVDKSKSQNQASMTGYNEHDLVHWPAASGFKQIELDYNLMLAPAQYGSWKFFFDAAPNPHASTLHEIMERTLNSDEFEKVEKALKKAVEEPCIMTKSLALLSLKK